MKRPLDQVERIRLIHECLLRYVGVTACQIADETSLSVREVHEAIVVMRKTLGLPIVINQNLQLSYTHRPGLGSDVFNLADHLIYDVDDE